MRLDFASVTAEDTADDAPAIAAPRTAKAERLH